MSNERRKRLRALGLMVHLSAEVTALARAALGPAIHSNLQLATVFSVERDPGIRPGDLAESLGVLPASMSRSLKTLTAAGLVDVTKDADDARVRRVLLTEEGRSRLSTFRDAMVRVQGGSDVRQIPHLLDATASLTPPADFDAALTALTAAGRRTDGAIMAAARRSIVKPHNPLDRWIVLTLYWGGIAPRPSFLAEWLHSSRPRMTAHLIRLEDDQLVARLRHKQVGDGRLVDLSLTRHGQASAAAMFRAFEECSGTLGRALADFAAVPAPGTQTALSLPALAEGPRR